MCNTISSTRSLPVASTVFCWSLQPFPLTTTSYFAPRITRMANSPREFAESCQRNFFSPSLRIWIRAPEKLSPSCVNTVPLIRKSCACLLLGFVPFLFLLLDSAVLAGFSGAGGEGSGDCACAGKPESNRTKLAIERSCRLHMSECLNLDDRRDRNAALVFLLPFLSQNPTLRLLLLLLRRRRHRLRRRLLLRTRLLRRHRPLRRRRRPK